LADDAYRKTSRASAKKAPVPENLGASTEVRAASQAASTAGLALRMAAMQADQWDAWEQIEALLRKQAPEIAVLLGLDAT
jgi:hypothetical protein